MSEYEETRAAEMRGQAHSLRLAAARADTTDLEQAAFARNVLAGADALDALADQDKPQITQEERDAGLSEAHSESYRQGWRNGRASVQITEDMVERARQQLMLGGFYLDASEVRLALEAALGGEA